MAAKIFRINYKSDFILTLNSDAGWMTPFCIKFWTGAPSQAFYVDWDGTTYTHCAYDPSEPTKLVVQFDDHNLPIGDLKFQIAYHFTVADFPNDTEDEVINPANITTEIDGETYQVMLDFTGETAPEIEFSLPAYANEAQRIANEQQRIAAETQRIANEETRIANEQTRINQEQTRQQNEQQRINQEQARVNEYATLKADAVAAAGAANDAATLAQQKAEYAQQQGGYAKEQGDYAKNQGDYAKEQGDTALADHQRAEVDHGIAVDDHTQAGNDHTQAGNDHTRAESDHGIAVDDHTQAGNDHTRAESDHGIAVDDHTRAESDHGIAVDDHTQAGNDHTRAESDHGIAVDDHTQAGSDHTRAESDHGIAVDDHTQAGTDHQTAAADHQTAGADHTQAGNDHTRAESDHTRAESDHAAVEVYVDSLGAFDISAYHAIGGVLAKYADLTAAIGTNGANIPDALRKGGMSIKFVQTSDNKYVQCRYMLQYSNTTEANAAFIDESNWMCIDNEINNIPDNGMCFYRSVNYDNKAGLLVSLNKSIFVKQGSVLQISGNVTSLESGGVVAFLFKKSDNTYIQTNVSETGAFAYEYIADSDIEIIAYGENTNGKKFSGYCDFSANLVPDFYKFKQTQYAFNQDVEEELSADTKEIFDYFRLDSKSGYIGANGATNGGGSNNLVTNYIPVVQGDKFVYTGKFGKNDAIGMVWGYDSNKANPVKLVDSDNGIIYSEFTIPANIAFICAWSQTVDVNYLLSKASSIRGEVDVLMHEVQAIGNDVNILSSNVNTLSTVENVFVNTIDSGSNAKNGTASVFKGFIVNNTYKAPGAGAIKKLYIYSPQASNDVKVCTCKKSVINNSFTIKAVYSYTLPNQGLNVIDVNIPMNKGEYLGFFANSIANMLPYYNSNTNGWYWLTGGGISDVVVGQVVSAYYLANYSLAYGFLGYFSKFDDSEEESVVETVVATRNQDDYNSIRELINSLDASEKHKYIVYVPNGEWFECDLQGKEYIEVIGQDRDNTILYCDGTSDKLTPEDYSYSGMENTPLNELLQQNKHVFFLKNNCVVKNLTIRANNCKYCVHADNGGFTYANFENCVFYDYGSNNHPVGIGIHSGQEISMLNCIFKTTVSKMGIFCHNWNNQTKPTKLLVENSLFDNCGFINADELGSAQNDDWRIINCYSNLGGAITFVVDKNSNGDTFYTNPTTGNKESNPQAVPYCIKLNCLGSNVVSCRPGYFDGNVQAIARPNFAKYLMTDHYIKCDVGTYQVGSVIDKIPIGLALVDYSKVVGIVESIIDGYAYVAKDTVWLGASDIEGTVAVNTLVYKDANGLVSTVTGSEPIGKIVELDSASGLYHIVIY